MVGRFWAAAKVALLLAQLLHDATAQQLMPDGALSPTALDPADTCGDIGELFAKVGEINAACCPPDSTGPAACDGDVNAGFGAPEVCSLDCGAALAPLMENCGALLDALAPLDAADGTRDGQATILRALQIKCEEIPPIELLDEIRRLQELGRCPSRLTEGTAATAIGDATCRDERPNCAAMVAVLSCDTDMCPSCPFAGQCDKTCGICDGHAGGGHRLQDEAPQCSAGEFDAETQTVNEACCDSADGCTGVPQECDARCAIPFAPFYERCSSLLRVLVPGGYADYSRLYDTCTTQLPAGPLLQLIGQCRAVFCGNGIVEAPEECDLGEAGNDGLACRADCTVPVCGDGVIDDQMEEQCDPPDGLSCFDGCVTIVYDSQCDQPYETLNDPWRAANAPAPPPLRTDTPFGTGPGYVSPTGIGDNRWYRFTGPGGDAMPLSHPGDYQCGSAQPGWLTDGSRVPGRYPSVEEGVMDMIVCFDRSDAGAPCNAVATVGVVRCAEFFLWRLPYTQSIYSTYCTTASGIWSLSG